MTQFMTPWVRDRKSASHNLKTCQKTQADSTVPIVPNVGESATKTRDKRCGLCVWTAVDLLEGDVVWPSLHNTVQRNRVKWGLLQSRRRRNARVSRPIQMSKDGGGSGCQGISPITRAKPPHWAKHVGRAV
jgi:hypothetical protein